MLKNMQKKLAKGKNKYLRKTHTVILGIKSFTYLHLQFLCIASIHKKRFTNVTKKLCLYLFKRYIFFIMT
jgi:hypothetical protein